MHSQTNWKDDEVLEKMKRVSKDERGTQTQWLQVLAEIERRQLHAREGFGSLFDYVVDELKYARGTAAKRIQVMRTAEKYPVIYSFIEKQRLCLTAVSQLAPHLCTENHLELLEKAAAVSTRDLDFLLARVFPKPDVPEAIRKLPTTKPPSNPSAPPVPTVPRKLKQKIEPLSETRIGWHFSSSQQFRRNFEKAKGLLKHKFPHGRVEDILGAALDAFLDKNDPARRPERKPRAVSPRLARLASRYIPRGIQNAVWKRDEARCAYISPSGKRCNSTSGLEYDHCRPFALGGSSQDAGNLRLLCRTHNVYFAEKTFGKHQRKNLEARAF